MGLIINPYSFAQAAEGIEALFAHGETGDYWRFDNVHTDQTTVGNGIGTATGVVNGRQLTQASATLKPTLQQPGARYVARFDGSNDYMVHAIGSTVSQPGTAILCLTNSSSANPRAFLTGGSSTARWQISVDGGGTADLIAYAGATLDSTLNAPLGTRVLTVEFNGASTKYYSNGTLLATGDAGSQSTNQITLGALYDGTFAGSMDLYSLIFINRLLTSTERDYAERFLGVHAGLSW